MPLPSDLTPAQREAILANGETTESMVSALRAAMNAPTPLNGYARRDGTVDEELIAWLHALIPWIGRMISTRTQSHILEIMRLDPDDVPELRYNDCRLHKNRKLAKGVYDAIMWATQP